MLTPRGIIATSPRFDTDVTQRSGVRRGALWRAHSAFALALLAILSGCGYGVSAMNFFNDHRVRVVAPEDGTEITRLPVEVRWEVRGFEITGRDGQRRNGAGYFAVFVDRSPIPPGTSLEWFARQDGSCGQDACGKVENLAYVYTTEEPSVTLEQLPAIQEKSGIEKHEVIIVLLDGTGRRIGESAFSVRFKFAREASL